MKPSPLSILSVAAALTILLTARAPAAQKHAEIAETALNRTALQPGDQAVIAVVVEIKPGFHAQSHTPSSEDFIPFTAKADAAPSVEFLEPVFPPGEKFTDKSGTQLNVYTGRVIVFLPLRVSAAAVPGPQHLSGRLRYQICDDNACFPPESPAFSLDTNIVASGQPAGPQKPELFKTFDPRVFAKHGAATAPATAPSSMGPASPPPAAAGTEFDVFGYHFSLARNSYGIALGIAFIVGVIFNLMPCVLPVVPLKAIGFYEVSQHNRLKSLGLGTVFSLGLLSSFALLAILVVVTHKLAWGEQFSNPWFVWPVVIVLIAMALGMFGLFTLFLPTAVYRFSPRHDTISGNFLFGMFTAVLSTPCTAPMFVGLLVWAGLQPRWLGVTTVMTVGAGMASPYLLLSAMPEVARKFPRSGPWAELVKQMMGFLLLAVAAYFAGGRLFTGRDFFWVVFAIIAAGCLYMVVRTVQFSGRPAVTAAVVIALLVGGATLGFTLRITGFGQPQGRELIAWKPYSETNFASARASGQIVMVEFTANWCANCLELEARVFHDPRAADALHSEGVVTLRADLTRDDAPGWEKLRQLNASGGIPLTAIYPPGREMPIELTSTYTTQNLLAAIQQAKSPLVASATDR